MMFMSQHDLGEEMKQILLSLLLFVSICSADQSKGHHINFNDVPAIEFIRFVSKISQVNFIFDHRDLSFNITMSSGKSLNSEEVVRALIQMLRMHGFGVREDGNYYVIHRYTKEEIEKGYHLHDPSFPIDKLLAGNIPPGPSEELEFSTYKLRYHQGDEIESALKKIALDLGSRSNKPIRLIEAIQTMQWVKGTNSFFFSGAEDTVRSLDNLIKTLDIPRRQVFIEVLVVETDAKKNSEFGLQWLGGGKFKDKIAFGSGNLSGKSGPAFAKTAQGVNTGGGLSGLDQIPLGRGFDLGIIGDLILHKGKTFLTLGSLVSALETDGESNIVLNQKLITQDNKNSKIFVGDTIPFTGSIVSTVGNSQQTTANIEYRDIGVNLSITPMLGKDDVITLNIEQEITEAIDESPPSATEVEGIRTTKTNMSTLAHVPDNHFLALSGMARNARSYQRAGIPCLGGLPLVGAAFSKNKRLKERRNVMIFVRPHILNSLEDYTHISEEQEGYEKVLSSGVAVSEYPGS